MSNNDSVSFSWHYFVSPQYSANTASNTMDETMSTNQILASNPVNTPPQLMGHTLSCLCWLEGRHGMLQEETKQHNTHALYQVTPPLPHIFTLHPHTSHLTYIYVSPHLAISPSPHSSPPHPLTMGESHILLCDALQLVPALPLDPGEGVCHPLHWVTPLSAKGNTVALHQGRDKG